MLSLSQTTGYAIKALAFLGTKDEPVLIRDISAGARVPAPYLAKIIRRLHAAGIVHAKRGHHGGVTLARPPEWISLLDIGNTVEGADVVGDCLLGNAFCDDLTACPTWKFWRRTGALIRTELSRLTLADIIAFNRKHARRERKPLRRAAAR